MPQNTTVTLTARQWTQLTDADVTLITFQNTGAYHILIKATTDATAPTDANGSLRYNPGQGERNVALADLFPGISGADRLFAFCDAGVDVMVSHA